MKSMIFASLLLMGVGAQAESLRGFLESSAFDEVCDKSVYAKPPFEAIGSTWSGFYQFRRPLFAESEDDVYIGTKTAANVDGFFAIYRVSKTNPGTPVELFRFQEDIHDLVYLENSLWALGSNQVTKVDLANQNRSTIFLQDQPPIHKYDRAYDMEVDSQNRLVVAAGFLGLKVINTEQMTVERTLDLGLQQSGGRKSLAVSLVKIEGQKMMVGVTNLTMPASETFNGLMEVNLSGGVIRYPYKSGVLSQVAKMRFQDGMIWINNWDIIQYASLENIRKQKAVNTNFIVTKLPPSEGKVWSAQPLGEFFILGDDFFACAVRSQVQTTKPSPKKGIAYRLRDGGKPTVLEFKKYRLTVDPIWMDGPYASDFKLSTLQVYVANSKGEPTSLPPGVSLEFYGVMPSMSHPAMGMGFFEEVQKGTYINREIQLGMTGDWKMELQLQNEKFEILDQVIFAEYL